MRQCIYKFVVVRDLPDGWDTHAPGSSFERPHFRGVNPADRCKRQSVNNDEEIWEWDDSVSWAAMNKHLNIFVSIHTICYGLVTYSNTIIAMILPGTYV